MEQQAEADLSNQFVHEETWLREFAMFHGSPSVLRYTREDMNGVPIVHVMDALGNAGGIWCDKCDGPGTVCVIEAEVGSEEKVRIRVHFESQTMSVTIRRAEYVKESSRAQHHAA